MVELEWAELDIPRLLTRPAGVPGDGARLTAPPHLYTEVLHFEAIRVVDPRAMAFTNVSGRADADVHVFYNRVAGFEDRVHMPEFLGNVLAHELAHALQGVARHSLEGLMKAVWSGWHGTSRFHFLPRFNGQWNSGRNPAVRPLAGTRWLLMLRIGTWR